MFVAGLAAFLFSFSLTDSQAQVVKRNKALKSADRNLVQMQAVSSEPSRFFYSIDALPGAKGSGVGSFEDRLEDNGVYCAFALGRTVKIWIENATDTCHWSATSAPDGNPTFGVPWGRWKDTVNVTFKNEFLSLRKITIIAQEGQSSSSPKNTITVIIPRRASTANPISVAELIDDTTYCQGLDYTAVVQPDPEYTESKDGYNQEGHPNASLSYTWSIAEETGAGPEISSNLLSDPSKMYSYTVEINDYAGKFWVVQPKTCEPNLPSISPTTKEIINVIPQNLTLENLSVRAIRYTESAAMDDVTGGESAGPDWDTVENADYLNACIYYSRQFNSNEANVTENSLNLNETENGYVYLQAMPYRPGDISFRNFEYEWIYDKEDLEIATEKMQDPLYVNSGFGEKKGRICFKVKDRQNATTNEIKVSFRVYCPKCEEMASAQGKNLKYEKKSSTITLYRIDSLQDEKISYTPQITNQSGSQIIGDVPKICGTTVYGLCNVLPENDESGVSGFKWEVPSSWTPGSGGDAGGGMFPFAAKSSDPLCDQYTTPKVSGDAGHLGDTINLLTYPQNACFRNGSDTSRNAKILKVYLRATPKAPVLIDKVEPEHPVYTGVDMVEDQWGGGAMLPENTPPVLLCNNSGLRGYPGSSGQQYYLYNENDAISAAAFDPLNPSKGGYGVVIKAEEEVQKALSYRFLPYSLPAAANDTNIIEFNLDVKNHAVLKGRTQIPVGIFSASECGPGDTAFFAINIIDTIPVYNHVREINSAEDVAYDTITLCEGVRIDLGTESSDYKSLWTASDRNTDRVDYVWSLPQDWRFNDPVVDSTGNPSRIWIGPTKGSVRLAFRNRCGTGSFRSADYIDVNAYTRVKIKVAEAIGPNVKALDPSDPGIDEFLIRPCQGSFLVYAADTFERTDRYQWTFPEDWTVKTDNPNYGTGEADPDRPNVAYTDNDNRNYYFNDMRVHVKVGSDTGYIYVVGAKEACGFTFDNYSSGYMEVPPVGHRRDSLKVVVRPFTSTPVQAFDWPDGLCARQVHTLAVMADPAQDSLTRVNTYFSWKFPDGYTSVDYTDGTKKDTVTFTVPHTPGVKDTIIVFSHRKDCELYNEGDSLVYVFTVTDTLSLDPGSMMIDLLRPKERLNRFPCEGDTVFYSLKGNNNHLDSVVWTWNGGNALLKSDSVDITGWRVLNRPGSYADTLKLIVGRSSLVIGAQAASFCGLSAMWTDTIRPVSLVRERAGWIESRALLCEGEKVVFQIDSVKNAVAYQWNYPWGSRIDTLDGYRNVYREFPANTDFSTGWICVLPYNSCGVGPYSDSIEISQVIARLGAPSLKALNPDRIFPVLNDTVVDTVCLRTVSEYQASFSYPAYSGVSWKYKWFGWNLDPADVLSVSDLPADSSQARWEKNAGFTRNFIGVAVRHQACLSYGDTLVLAVYPLDTVSIPEGRSITDYMVDAKLNGSVQLRPCGADTAVWLVNRQIHPSVTDYRFVWNGGRQWNQADSTMAGTTFKWLNPKQGETQDSYYANDTLSMVVGNGSWLDVALEIRNRCGVSHTDSVRIRTSVKLDKPVTLTMKNPQVCDLEKLEFEVSGEQLDETGNYIWAFPWGDKSDTTTYPSNRFEGISYQTGQVTVTPYNGCGPGTMSDPVDIAEVLRIPLRAEPGNFDPDYNYIKNPIAKDSLCMNQPLMLKVNFPGRDETRQYESTWIKIQGSEVGFEPFDNTDSCRLAQRELSSDPFIIQVASRVKGCQLYSDTLRIEIFPMDTLSFATRVVEDLGPFQVDLPSIVINRGDKNPIDLRPCGGIEQQYSIASDIHWSLLSDTLPYFLWSAVDKVLQYRPQSDLSLAGTDWYYEGDTLPAGEYYRNLPLRVGYEDSLLLSVRLRNVCGSSQSPALILHPMPVVRQKPVLQCISPAVCLDLPVEFQTSEPRNAENYYWEFPWYPYQDTTELPLLTVGRVSGETGPVVVWPFNKCGIGPSDTLQVDFIVQTPMQPLPDWRADDSYVWTADTIEEQICLHGETSLRVRKDPRDGSGLVFKWAVWEGDGIEMVPVSGQADSICTVRPVEGADIDGQTVLMVWGEYPSCGGRGRTLYIRMNLVDTIPVADLGSIEVFPEDLLLDPQPCPESEIVFQVENDVAPAYRWTLPPTWSFKEGTDSTAAIVTAVVGSMSGKVTVAPRTDPAVLGCDFVSPTPLGTTEFVPRAILQTEDFAESFESFPCVGSVVTYVAEETPGARAYRWEFPGNWKILEAGAENDTLWPTGTFACNVMVGSDSGYVKVYALDSCGDRLIRGTLRQAAVTTIDTAELNVLGDTRVCIDSVLVLVVEAANAYADPNRYVLEIDYMGTDQTPLEVVYPNPADSTYLEVRCLNSDSVALKFTPKNPHCPQNVKTFVHYILADTIPTIPGTITGPDTICIDNQYSFTFRIDPEVAAALDTVTYTWVLPHEGWCFIEGRNDTVLTAYIDSIPAARRQGIPVEAYSDTLLCYPRGFCGTAFPTAFVVWFVNPDPFADTIVVDDPRPCIGTEIHAGLKGEYNTDTIRFVWNTPRYWTRLDTDSLPSTSYRVQYDTASYITVRYMREGSCGLSQTIRTRVTVRDSAAKARLLTTVYPCYTKEYYEFLVGPDPTIDTVKWYIPDGFEYQELTTVNSSIYHDSAWIRNADSSLVDPFHIRIRTVNECGSRDTLLRIRPVSGIVAFEDSLHVVRYCVADTGYAHIAIPSGQRDDGTRYTWLVDDTSYRWIASSVEEDSIAVHVFRSGPDSRPVNLVLAASNDCGALEPDTIAIRPFTYGLTSRAWRDKVVYGESENRLKVYSTDAGPLRDFFFTWGPEDRLVPGEAGSSERYTGKLVLPIETFHVVSQQKLLQDTAGMPFYLREGLCFAYDTVRIEVDSLFSLSMAESDTACIDVPVRLSLGTDGGNQDFYHLTWWFLEADSSWTELTEYADSLQLEVNLGQAGEYVYRVIGWDSTFVYAYTEDEDGTVREDPDRLVLQTTHSDTAYALLRVFDLEVGLGNVLTSEIEVPAGGRVALEARVSGGTGQYLYSWTPEDQILRIDSLTGDMNTRALFRSQDFIFAVEDALSGCVGEHTLRIVVGDQEDIPNTFTPNGDGKNDIFLKGVSKLTIYTRWGDEIFSSTQGEGWDGTYKGKVVRPGEYLYVAEILREDGSMRIFKGVVTVIVQ